MCRRVSLSQSIICSLLHFKHAHILPNADLFCMKWYFTLDLNRHFHTSQEHLLIQSSQCLIHYSFIQSLLAVLNNLLMINSLCPKNVFLSKENNRSLQTKWQNFFFQQCTFSIRELEERYSKILSQIYIFKSLNMSYRSYLYYLVEFNSLICDEYDFCRTCPAESQNIGILCLLTNKQTNILLLGKINCSHKLILLNEEHKTKCNLVIQSLELILLANKTPSMHQLLL